MHGNLQILVTKAKTR